MKQYPLQYASTDKNKKSHYNNWELGHLQWRVPEVTIRLPSTEDREGFLQNIRIKYLKVFLNNFITFLMSTTITYKNIHSRKNFQLWDYQGKCIVIKHLVPNEEYARAGAVSRIAV